MQLTIVQVGEFCTNHCLLIINSFFFPSFDATLARAHSSDGGRRERICWMGQEVSRQRGVMAADCIASANDLPSPAGRGMERATVFASYYCESF